MSTLGKELQRRHSFTKDVEAYFRLHEREWIPASALMTVGGRMAWRSRVAEVRPIFEREGGTLENRQQRHDGEVLSEYRYLPQSPLGRDATQPEEKAWTDSYRSQERLF